MEDKGESGGKYRLGSHWQTIQRSLFPDWEREADEKAVEEEKRRHRLYARRVVCRVGLAKRGFAITSMKKATALLVLFFSSSASLFAFDREETLQWFREHQFGATPVGRPSDEVFGERSVSFFGGSWQGTPEIALPLEGQIGATRRYKVGKIRVRYGICPQGTCPLAAHH